MNVSVPYLCGVLLSACLVFDHQPPKPVTPAQSSPFVLDGSVIAQRSCRGDGQMFAEHLTVRLTLRNKSDDTLIVLLSGSHNDVQVAADSTRLGSGELEMDYEPDVIFATGGHSGVTKDAFLVIEPHSLVPVPQAVLVALPVAIDSSIAGVAGPGDHVMTFSWDSQLRTEKEATRWRREFQKQGRLWNEPIRTQPIKFTVPRTPHFEDCRGEEIRQE